MDLRSGITKKFSGRNALPRGRYRRTAAPEPAALERLRTLERAFHRRVRDDGAKLTTSLCGTYDLPTPQSLVDATTTAQAPVWKSTSATGAPDNSSLNHFSAMAWPRWLRRAVRNRHGHAIEQA